MNQLNENLFFCFIIQVFTGFRGETLFNQQDREAVAERKTKAAVKQSAKTVISEAIKKKDGNPKRLGILSKVSQPVDLNRKPNTTRSNMVTNSAKEQVILFLSLKDFHHNLYIF